MTPTPRYRCLACKSTLAAVRQVARIAMNREARGVPIDAQLAEIKRKREFMAACTRCGDRAGVSA